MRHTPAAWPQVLDFCGTPLVIERSPGQLPGDGHGFNGGGEPSRGPNSGSYFSLSRGQDFGEDHNGPR
jgi:hypothetical protein